VGDQLWTGKPPWHRTRHPGILSLSPPSVGRLQQVPCKSCGAKHAHHMIRQPVSVVMQYGASIWLKGLASGDQCRPMGSGSTLELFYTFDALYKSTFTLLT